MNPINIEKLLSHSVGISNSYYRPTENELLEDYLKVVDMLYIDKTNKIQQKLDEYQEKINEENYIIKGKIIEKEKQIHEMTFLLLVTFTINFNFLYIVWINLTDNR